MNEQDFNSLMEEWGYIVWRKMPDGSINAVQKYLFTFGLMVGVDPLNPIMGWKTRFCYGNLGDAMLALTNWDGTGDPPGLWIKQKPEERHGPGSPDFEKE